MKNYINVHQSFNSHINNIITINKFLLVQVLAGVIGQQAQLPGPDHLPVEQPNKSIMVLAGGSYWGTNWTSEDMCTLLARRYTRRRTRPRPCPRKPSDQGRLHCQYTAWN